MDFALLSSKVKIRHLGSLSPPPFDGSLHALNRARLVASLKSGASPPPPGSFALFAGGAEQLRHETDHEPIFRQESFFHWAFGVREPDCYGAICLDTGAATLFIPHLPPAYAVIMGRIKGPEEWRALYGVEAVEYVGDLARVLRAGVGASGRLLTLHGQNTDSHNFSKPASFAGIEEFTVDQAALWPAAVELRVIKTPAEQAQLRYVGAVSSEAHIAVMQAVCEGMVEYQLESLFSHWCHFYGGCRHNSYTCICASGLNSSVLHYGHAGEPNARTLGQGDMCLFDMGGEYACYGADITTSFPVSGKFTPAQRVVYDAVLAAVYAVEDAMAPGVNWKDLHTLSYR
jgi:Xaa-Pro dipeptidase